VDFQPGVDGDADAVEASGHFLGHHAAAAGAIDVQVIAGGDHAGDPRHLGEIESVRRCL